ncbi:MAG: hypothetical protein WC378_14285 [Opitutaceae bacterium]|jgi:hypothetical protein
MKISEFFERAFKDATYRREKLEELRYFKKVCIAVFCIITAAAVFVTVYTSLNGERWNAYIYRWLVFIVLCGWSYSTCVTRIAALKAIEKEPNQPPEPTPGTVTSAASAPVAPSPGAAHR